MAARIAAVMRGDQAERERLIQTAPQRTFSAPDCYFLDEAFFNVELCYIAHQLDQALTFWQGMHALSNADRELSDSAYLALRGLGYRIIQSYEGWALFCRSLKVEPPGPIVNFPGWRNVLNAVEMARIVAFDRDEMAEWPGGAGEIDPADSAEGWRRAFEHCA